VTGVQTCALPIWFWDGEGIWYDNNLASTSGQKFPKREVMTANMLLDKLS